MLLRVKPLRGTDGSRVWPSDMTRTYRGARMHLAVATDPVFVGTGTFAIPLGTVDEDIGGWHSGGSPDLFTVPTGVSRVQVTTTAQFFAVFGASDIVVIEVVKNGSLLSPEFSGCAYQAAAGTGGADFLNTWRQQTQSIPVVAGDTFSLQMQIVVLTPASLTVVGGVATGLAIEAVTC